MATQYTAGLVQGQKNTAAIMNSIGAAYETYTPTWTNLTVGNATQTFRYGRINKLVYAYGSLVFGSTTSITGTPRFTLPVTAATADSTIIGQALFEDSGTALYPGIAIEYSTTACTLHAFLASGTYASASDVSSTVPFTWGSGDRIHVNIVYEAA